MEQHILSSDKVDLPQPRASNNLAAPYIVTALVSGILSALIIGGGVFYWQRDVAKQQTEILTKQIEVMRKENQLIKSQITVLQKAKTEANVQKEAIEKLTCKGTWKNGICLKSTCIDSDVNEKPEDIYIKGSVTFTNENGVETVVRDECTGSQFQVNEMWCYESPSGSGNYVQGSQVNRCPKGCLDGACVY